jgi:monoamine oxidase
MSRSILARLARQHDRGLTSLERRRFLKTTLAVGAGTLLSNAALGGLVRPALGAKRIVVIGAGFGGLACAHELKSAGYDVTVVEARERLGGRVLSFSDFVPGKNVEGGGELIGSNHPTWVAYAEKFGLEFLDVTEDEEAFAPIMIDGKVLEAEQGDEIWEAIDKATEKLYDDARSVDPDAPWTHPKAAELDKRTIAQFIGALELSPEGKKIVTVDFAANMGQDTSRQSYLGYITQVKGGGVETYLTESEVYRCKGGNQQLAAKLADAIGRDRVVLGLPVTIVEDRGSKVIVTCKDGRTIECDDVVVATPPSVWNRVEFRPGLPGTLKPQMGVNVKYLAHVKSPYWEKLDPKRSQYTMTDGPLSMTWEGTDNQREADKGEGASLHCFSGGPAAERVRALSKEQRAAMYAGALESLLPGFKDNFVRDRFMDWPGEAWTNAGYSFPGPGEVTTVGPAMARGLGRVHFAGEHTCYKFVGYMEGGLNSGAALAKRLAKRDGV